MVLIVIGMIIGQFTGFNDTVTLTAGDTCAYEDLGFEIRLDSFEVIYDGDDNITDYISTVTVIEDGEEVLTTNISVNNPLEYKGVKFYQSTYAGRPRC
jgi:cytochrome c biogenesis protein